jgi:lysophospholipase L1-like esterase
MATRRNSNRSVDGFMQVRPAVLSATDSAWKPLIRIDPPSGDVAILNDLVAATPHQKLIFAEGDSWFDKFTPIPFTDNNLLSHIRTPFIAKVIDCALVGDVSRDMVRGFQRLRTKTILSFHGFDAILLSAGGNNLKDVVADKIMALVQSGNSRARRLELRRASSYQGTIEEVIQDIRAFVALRDASPLQKTRNAPLILHGYDYLQPRPAAAQVFAGVSGLRRGPWLHPILTEAGFTDAEMRSLADAIVDEINRQMAALAASLSNVHFIDQRGLLTPAAPLSTGGTEHWLDEIHPNQDGFKRLAENRWNVAVAKALGWKPITADLVVADATVATSTAVV